MRSPAYLNFCLCLQPYITTPPLTPIATSIPYSVFHTPCRDPLCRCSHPDPWYAPHLTSHVHCAPYNSISPQTTCTLVYYHLHRDATCLPQPLQAHPAPGKILRLKSANVASLVDSMYVDQTSVRSCRCSSSTMIQRCCQFLLHDLSVCVLKGEHRHSFLHYIRRNQSAIWLYEVTPYDSHCSYAQPI